MRLHYVTECSSHWSFRLIESSAGWDLPQYFLPSESNRGGLSADGPKVVFFNKGEPKWIGTFAISPPADVFIIQFSEDEVFVPLLDYLGSVLNIYLIDPTSSYVIQTWVTGLEPRIQFIGGRIILVNTVGFSELRSDGVKTLFYQYDDGMMQKLLLFDTIIDNVKMPKKDVFTFEMVEYDHSRVEVCYDVVKESIIYQRMILKEED